MSLFAKRGMHCSAMLAITLFGAGSFALAAPTNYRQSPKYVAVEEKASHQQQQAATRECDQAGGDDRRSCTPGGEAGDDRELAAAVEAKLILHGRVPMRARVRGNPCNFEGDQHSITQ